MILNHKLDLNDSGFEYDLHILGSIPNSRSYFTIIQLKLDKLEKMIAIHMYK